ncbi:uncharacterized protein LOC141640890 [Silene latifolia]|uniref:uncharacterized protein LOC141640890 n=1 Tax=Silene latifolia TaxID=37657 RepID=UPI003D76A620
MPWLKLAVNKVIEEENKKKANFSRIRNVVDNVVFHAGHVVSTGVNLFQDRIVSQSRQSFKQEMKRLEEDFTSSRGKERVLLLQKLLGLLVQIEKMNQNFSDDDKRQIFQQDKNVETDKELTEVSHNDLKHANYANEELSLYEVFFQSQVIERILLSMILEAPNDEEINHLLEIFRVTLIPEKDLHISVIHWIKDLAEVFSTYHEEILMKREELLQFAQVAMSGLKKNVDITRIDVEANNLKSQVYSIAIKPLGIEDDHELFQPKSFLADELQFSSFISSSPLMEF